MDDRNSHRRSDRTGSSSGQPRKRDEDSRERLDAALDVGLEETFPGSDPVAVTQPPHSPLDKKDAQQR